MIKIKFKSRLNAGTCLMLVPFIIACGSSNIKEAERRQNSNSMHHGHHKKTPGLYEKRQNAATLPSENGHYMVSLFCNESPIPMSKIHNWTIHIETNDGKPVENAKVYIFGGMPMHNHEFPTTPRVKEYLGNGDYRVEGIKFSMIGHWEMHFNIEHDKKRDRVEFKIHI